MYVTDEHLYERSQHAPRAEAAGRGNLVGQGASRDAGIGAMLMRLVLIVMAATLHLSAAHAAEVRAGW